MIGCHTQEILDAVKNGELRREDDGTFAKLDIAGWHESREFLLADQNSFYFPLLKNGAMHIADIGNISLEFYDLCKEKILDKLDTPLVKKYCVNSTYNRNLSAIKTIYHIDFKFAEILKHPAILDYANFAFKGKKWIPHLFNVLVRSHEGGRWNFAHRDISWYVNGFRREPMTWIVFDLSDSNLSDGGPNYQPESNRTLVNGILHNKSADLSSMPRIGKMGQISCFNTGVIHGTPPPNGVVRHTFYLTLMAVEEFQYSRRPSSWIKPRIQVMEKLCLW